MPSQHCLITPTVMDNEITQSACRTYSCVGTLRAPIIQRGVHLNFMDSLLHRFILMKENKTVSFAYFICFKSPRFVLIVFLLVSKHTGLPVLWNVPTFYPSQNLQIPVFVSAQWERIIKFFLALCTYLAWLFCMCDQMFWRTKKISLFLKKFWKNQGHTTLRKRTGKELVDLQPFTQAIWACSACTEICQKVSSGNIKQWKVS